MIKFWDKNKHKTIEPVKWGEYPIESSRSYLISNIRESVLKWGRDDLNYLAASLYINDFDVLSEALLKHYIFMKIDVISLDELNSIYDWVFPTWSEDELV